jgi:hypothetical protein
MKDYVEQPEEPCEGSLHAGNEHLETRGPWALRWVDVSAGPFPGAWPDIAGLTLHPVRSPMDPVFLKAYAVLADTFAAAGELESRDVLAARLHGGARTIDETLVRGGITLVARYGMDVVLNSKGHVIGVRDHTVVWSPNRQSSIGGEAVVHLSHAWVAPEQRGRGVGLLLRGLAMRAVFDFVPGPAWGEATAKDAAGTGRVALVAEMDPVESEDDTVGTHRLATYGRSGFHVVDPSHVSYTQPSFTGPAGDALPLWLVVRTVPAEHDHMRTDERVRGWIEALHAQYALDLCESSMTEAEETTGVDDGSVRMLTPADAIDEAVQYSEEDEDGLTPDV